MVKEYKEGSIVVGTVTGIKDYGIFVKLDNYNNDLFIYQKLVITT